MATDQEIDEAFGIFNEPTVKLKTNTLNNQTQKARPTNDHIRVKHEHQVEDDEGSAKKKQRLHYDQPSTSTTKESTFPAACCSTAIPSTASACSNATLLDEEIDEMFGLLDHQIKCEEIIAAAAPQVKLEQMVESNHVNRPPHIKQEECATIQVKKERMEEKSCLNSTLVQPPTAAVSGSTSKSSSSLSTFQPRVTTNKFLTNSSRSVLIDLDSKSIQSNTRIKPLSKAAALAEAEAQHRAAIQASRPAAAASTSSTPRVPAEPSIFPYKPILSNRDILFSAPILTADVDENDESTMVFMNAPTTFSTNPYFATGNDTHFPEASSTEDLAKKLHERDDLPAAAAAAASSSSSSSEQWPITMRGKSIATVSQSAAVKAKLARRAVLEKEHEMKEATETLPTDQHVHGPGISDHTQQRAHYDGYWDLRTKKLAAQHANSDIYASLSLFQTEEQKKEYAKKEERKRRREEAHARKEEAAWLTETQPEDVPFSLAQSTSISIVKDEMNLSMNDAHTNTSSATAASSTSSTNSTTDTAASPASSSSKPRIHTPPDQIFAGLVCYINGDTETRLQSFEGSGSELSSYHLTNLVKLGGGSVLPFPSRSRMTHYIVDHLSYSKARSEFQNMFVKVNHGHRSKPIHFVKRQSSSVRHCCVVRSKLNVSHVLSVLVGVFVLSLFCALAGWIRACMQAGYRVREESFSVLQDDSSRSIRQAWAQLKSTPTIIDD